MSRQLFGPGLRGEVAEQIQRALVNAGFDTNGVDGQYGGATAAAVEAFQAQQAIPVTGTVDDVTWDRLLNQPIPATDLRSLWLTATIEGHNYTLAMGNWDGAWLTWGLVGFTLKHGEVQKIIANVGQDAPQRISDAFGAQATELRNIMQAPQTEQAQWADSITANGRLIEPWLSAFARFGGFPEVQQEQRRRANEDYFQPALNTARNLGLKTELGVALCFDIHVQNGGIGPAARSMIAQRLSQGGAPDESALRLVIADSVADSASPQFRDDVRARKQAIASGDGTVHGLHLVLANWGLSEAPAPELT